MKFGRYPVSECEGWILAHSVRIDGTMMEKGRTLTPVDIKVLSAAGIETIMAAQLEDGDIGENIAAARIAKAITGRGLVAGTPARGRVNVRAILTGLLVQGDELEQTNALDEGISISALPSGTIVRDGQLVATVKIIPFAVGEDVIASAEALNDADDKPAAICAQHLDPHRAALIQTELPGFSQKLLKKTQAVTAARLERLGSRLEKNALVPHDEDKLAEIIAATAAEGYSPILIMGASATLDRRDVVPEAIKRAGGSVDRFGMPVDPGNLLVLGHIHGTAIIGLPGCARSAARNGFDWVLERVLAEVDIEKSDIVALGGRGLLKEGAGRPQPRDATVTAAPDLKVAAIVLAAGTSSRMGVENKLLAPAPDAPMISTTVDALSNTDVAETVVVTGHEADKIRAALEDCDLRIAENPDYINGLGASVACGVRALSADTDAALIVLGDMPLVRPETIDALIEGYAPDAGVTVCAPSFEGKRGNPVLWGRTHFPDLAGLTGDCGARDLLGALGDTLGMIETNDPGVLFDVDTRDALQKLSD